MLSEWCGELLSKYFNLLLLFDFQNRHLHWLIDWHIFQLWLFYFFSQSTVCLLVHLVRATLKKLDIKTIINFLTFIIFKNKSKVGPYLSVFACAIALKFASRLKNTESNQLWVSLFDKVITFAGWRKNRFAEQQSNTKK